MRNSKDLNIKFNDPEWYFLAEYYLSEITADTELQSGLRGGLLFQTIQDLGVPPECLINIEETLNAFIEEMQKYLHQGKFITPVCIRLFCQKKAVEEVNSMNPASLFSAEQAKEPTQIFHHSGAKSNGGWGYFLVERGDDIPSGSLASSSTRIDLYLYKEGD